MIEGEAGALDRGLDLAAAAEGEADSSIDSIFAALTDDEFSFYGDEDDELFQFIAGR